MNQLNRDKWEGRFDDKFCEMFGHGETTDFLVMKPFVRRTKLVNFIRTLLEEAKASERKKWFKDYEDLENRYFSVKQETIDECLEALPKKTRHNNWVGCGKPLEACDVCSFNKAIDQAISAISNKK